MTEKFFLEGAADLVGSKLGFLTPVFRKTGGNRRLVQRVRSDGTISGFVPFEIEGAELLEAEPIEIEVGEPELWIFAFDFDDWIVGRDVNARQEFSRRVYDPLFEFNPALGLEAARFLNHLEARLAYSFKTFDHLYDASPTAADSWRDSHVLTYEVELAFLKSHPVIYQRIVGDCGLMLSFNRGNINVKGLVSARIRPSDRDRLISVVERVFVRLHSLYQRESKHLATVKLVHQDDSKPTTARSSTSVPPLEIGAVFVGVDDAGELTYRLRADPRLRTANIIDHFDVGANEFDAEIGDPVSFNVSDLQVDGQSGGRGWINILLRKGKYSRLSPDEQRRIFFKRSESYILCVPQPMPMNRSSRLAEDIIEAIELISTQHTTGNLPEDTEHGRFIIQAVVQQPLTRVQVMCLLLDELSLRESIGRHALLSFRFSRRGIYDSEDRIAQVFFPGCKISDNLNLPYHDSRPATIVSPSYQYERAELLQHVGTAVQFLATELGWRASFEADVTDGRQHHDRVNGPRRLELGANGEKYVLNIGEGSSAPGTSREKLPLERFDLHDIGYIAVDHKADPAKVVRCLVRDQVLRASVRDISHLRPGRGGVAAVLAGQASRFTSKVPTIWKTRFFALLVSMSTRAAFEFRVDTQQIVSMIQQERYPALDMLCDRVEFDEAGATIAIYTAIKRASRPPYGSVTTKDRRHSLVIRADGKGLRIVSLDGLS